MNNSAGGSLPPDETASEPVVTSENPKNIRYRISTTLEDIKIAWVLRGAVFLGEEGGIYNYWFGDENDLCSIHVNVFVDGEPAGTARIRCYSEFAWADKMCILKKYRQFSVLRQLVAGVYAVCHRRGYAMLAGAVRRETETFWRRQGGEVIGPAVDTQSGRLTPVARKFPGGPDPKAIMLVDVGPPEFVRRMLSPEFSDLNADAAT